MSKKILVVIGGSYVSGLEVVTLHLIRGLKENGYNVQCLINKWNDGVFKNKLDELEIKYDQIKLGWFHLRKPVWTINSLIHYPKAFFTAKKVINKFNPDICHFCHYPITVPLLSLINCKAVYNLQETHLPTRKHNLIYKLLDKKINIFTAVSNHIVNVLKNLGIPDNKIKLVYNGIPTINDEFVLTEKIQKNTLHFAIIGQVAEWKGHSVLINAVECLVKKGINDFKIFVFGNEDNEYGRTLKKLLKEKNLEKYFSWQGFVNDQEYIYSSCEVVLVPSLSGEPCSLTIIESMTKGKGLIVSDRGGNPELVKNKSTGLIYSVENFELLAECMNQYITNRNLITEFGKNARTTALQSYTYKNMTDKYIEIYESL